MKFRLLILVVMMFGTTICGASVCANDTSICSFYCQKSRDLNCPQDNYLMGFGYKYCQLFLKKNPMFSFKGQKILSHIRQCLVQNLSSERGLNCQNAKVVGAESHASCYIQSGFCNLKFKEKWQIFWLIRHELFDTDFQNSFQQIHKACRK